MLSNLPSGVKISISRSIKTAFEQYMAKILWGEDAYRFEDFMKEWREYIHNHASWYDQISDEMKASDEFHQELADKITEVIEKIFSEEPTSKQIEELESLQKELNTSVDYSCKAEAKFYLSYLKEQLKKKKQS
ncbi:hypothetical protein [Bacillus thermotolerans]|uniref:hypothetical protein n=1 Tax=Bacillus thermotolerans TaxID=1221996 RepID=UPI00057C99D1|nr:hypothetical protein [Bacillus thermotolerans]KKB36550.1 hypothetical protein QY97_00949 [Bacillus thermotolerans]